MKSIQSSFTAILACAILLLTNIVTTAADADLKTEIQRLSDKFSQAASRGDAAALAAFYTEDALMLPLEAPTVKGRAAIRDFWKPLVEVGSKLQLTTTEATRAADFVHEIGSYTVKHADGSLLQQGKYLVIWKRAGKHLANPSRHLELRRPRRKIILFDAALTVQNSQRRRLAG